MFSLFIFLIYGVTGWTSEIHFITSTSFPASEQFEKTRVGGLSGLFFKNNSLYAISDDRGKIQEPRIYVLNAANQEKLKIQKVLFLKSNTTLFSLLDLESVVVLSNGQILTTSEGDNNGKPRAPPRLSHWEASGKFIEDLVLPKDWIPESTGMQHRGVNNNFSIESLTISADEKFLWTAVERPLLQDEKLDKKIIRIAAYEKGERQIYQLKGQYLYELSETIVPEGQIHVTRGVAEILHVEDQKILILERYLNVAPPKKLNFGAEIFEVDLASATLIKESDPIDLKKIQLGLKNKVLVYKDKKPYDLLGNVEGMAWLNEKKDSSRRMAFVSDNNFVKDTDTTFFFFDYFFKKNEKE